MLKALLKTLAAVFWIVALTVGCAMVCAVLMWFIWNLILAPINGFAELTINQAFSFSLLFQIIMLAAQNAKGLLTFLIDRL